MKHPICKTGDVPLEGEARILPFFSREVRAWRVYARIRAAAKLCLHRVAQTECKGGAFVCPWHGARFEMTNGQRLDGPVPAGARLMFLPTRIVGGELLYVWGETS